MIFSILMFILIVLLLALIITFSFYIFFPSINNNSNINEDPLFSKTDRTYVLPDETLYEYSEKRAIVLCSCNKDFKIKKADFNSEYTCFMAKSVYGSGYDCKFACIGLGDCMKVCPQKAISIINSTAVISNNCCGCGKCIQVCPQSVIKLIPKKTERIVMCSNVTKSMTSCSKNNFEEKVIWEDKKDFKIWKSCYRIIEHLKF